MRDNDYITNLKNYAIASFHAMYPVDKSNFLVRVTEDEEVIIQLKNTVNTKRIYDGGDFYDTVTKKYYWEL
jgi:hypothetical protein